MEGAVGITDIVSFYITMPNCMGRNLTFISPPIVLPVIAWVSGLPKGLGERRFYSGYVFCFCGASSSQGLPSYSVMREKNTGIELQWLLLDVSRTTSTFVLHSEITLYQRQLPYSLILRVSCCITLKLVFSFFFLTWNFWRYR